jgi:hypothetical protein
VDVRRLFRYPVLLVLAFLVLVLTAGQCNGAPNRPPAADAGEDRTVAVGELVTLDGSASSDPDGDALSFSWELETVPVGSTALLRDAGTPAPSFSPDVAGSYVATLTVSDGELEASDSVSVTANEVLNEPPSLSRIDAQRTLMNVPIEVAFTISDEDLDGVTFEASSSDATLVSDGDMEVLGSGAERLLRILPAPLVLGSVAIRLVVRDVHGLEDSTLFVLDVIQPFGTQVPKLTASDAAAGDWFGWSVAISGSHAVIGAPHTDADGMDSGSAYVFRRSGDGWIQNTTLPPGSDQPVVALSASVVSAGDGFGSAVAIDGDYVIVGAPFDSTQAVGAGVAYVYERCAPTAFCRQPWSEMGALTASDAAAGDHFGSSVAIDGDYVLIGAYGNDDHGTDSGAAYVFQRNGDSWQQVAKLTANDALAVDHFGWSVALDSNYALIGARLADTSLGFEVDSGAAYVFQRSGDSWNQTAKLRASDAAKNDQFGYSVALNGEYALIGARWDGDDLGDFYSGSAYVFQRSGDAWNETAKLTASDAIQDEYFGSSVALDGEYALIGAHRAIVGGIRAGSAYVFQRIGDTWSQIVKLTANDAATTDWFGWSVALDGDYALIGAYGTDDGGADSGSVYVFVK